MMKKPMLFMVYGTLMQGRGNNRLFGDSKFLGTCVTKEKYTMYVSGIPFVDPDEPTCQIKGEVFEVTDEEVLDRVDRLEGHPTMYQRRLTTVILDGKEIEAWLYFYPHKRFSNERYKTTNGDFRNPEFFKLETQV